MDETLKLLKVVNVVPSAVVQHEQTLYLSVPLLTEHFGPTEEHIIAVASELWMRYLLDAEFKNLTANSA